MLKNTKSILSSVSRQIIKKVSRNYIAGPCLDDAKHLAEQLISSGYWISLGYWDSCKDSLSHIQTANLESLNYLKDLSGRNYVSIKLPSLSSDEQYLQKYISGLLATCSDQTHIHFDSLAPEHADTIYKQATNFSESAPYKLGVTLPSRWLRSLHDAESLGKLPLNIRVVKGQWHDPQNPDIDPHANYLKLIKNLAGKKCRVRVATHNLELARQALDILLQSNTDCELELLYGLPVKKLIALARDKRVPVRIYIAFGHAYLPYALASLKKNPLAILGLLKELYRGNYLSHFPKLG